MSPRATPLAEGWIQGDRPLNHPQPSNVPDQPTFEIEIPAEVEAGVHADFASIWHTADTFVLDFAALRRPPELRTDPESGQSQAVFPVKIVSRVRVAPPQIFELMKALEAQLSAWEKETGVRKPEQ